MNIKVSDVIVKYLEKLGVRFIFGMPGAHILPVYDSLYHSPIKTVLAKHEQGASFMACGCSRVTGEVTACIATAGPGATNLVTGIANAYADRQPVIVITGETSTHIFGKGGLQESTGEGGSIDQCEIFRSITRYSRVIERTDYLENVLRRAAKELLSDTPGPVLLSLPFNIQREEVDDSILERLNFIKSKSHSSSNVTDVADAAELFAHSRKPVIVGGYGCIASNSESLLAELSNQYNIPVTSSLKGKGIIDENSPLSLGSIGVTSYGGAYSYLVNESDLILILGAGFNERTSYLWDKSFLEGKKLIQVDVNPDQLEKVYSADIAIKSDLNLFLTQFSEQLKINNTEAKLFETQNSLSTSEAGEFSKGEQQLTDKFPLVYEFFNRLPKAFNTEIQVFDDNIIFAQNFFKASDNAKYYPNSGVSSLGHAIPAAIGARMVKEVPAVVIIGDGGFQMCCMEIMTAVNYNVPLTIVIFNNSTMGLIRKNQFQKYDQRYIDCDFTNPDYKHLAESFGVKYYKVENNDDLDSLYNDIDVKNDINMVDFYLDKNAFPDYVTNR